VHTKKTPQDQDGAGELRRAQLMDQLLGGMNSAARVLQQFNEDEGLGLLVPKVSVEDLRHLRNHIDNTFWLDRLLDRMGRRDLIGNYAFTFPAGSMFWFRVDALDGFDNLALDGDAFEPELGQRDGTMAHALERLVLLYATQKGYRTREIDVSGT
jgi:lipopolysaccharide biosynthesis protein